MPTYADLTASPWLHGSDFKGKAVTLTITEVDEHVFEGDGKRGDEKRGTIAFKETAKKLGLNRTNTEALRALFGPDDQNVELNTVWVGKRVTFYPSPERNPATGKTEPAVRVKGSPDIEADITFTLVLPRKKPRQVTLVKTGKGKPANMPQNGAVSHETATGGVSALPIPHHGDGDGDGPYSPDAA